MLLLQQFPPEFFLPCRWPAVPFLLQKYMEGKFHAWRQQAPKGPAHPPASTPGLCPFQDDVCTRGWLQRPVPASASQRGEDPPRAAGARREATVHPANVPWRELPCQPRCLRGRTVLRTAGRVPALGTPPARSHPPGLGVRLPRGPSEASGLGGGRASPSLPARGARAVSVRGAVRGRAPRAFASGELEVPGRGEEGAPAAALRADRGPLRPLPCGCGHRGTRSPRRGGAAPPGERGGRGGGVPSAPWRGVGGGAREGRSLQEAPCARGLFKRGGGVGPP